MTEKNKAKTTGFVPLEPQPAVFVSLLLALNAGRRQMKLYGLEHPNTQQFVSSLSATLDDFTRAFGRSTLVFSRTAALINEHSYLPSPESQEIFRTLRSRGVMAVTIVAPPPPEQTLQFLCFLNDDPLEVRKQGGASASLRKRGVSLIVATDAVYTSGEETEDDEGASEITNPQGMDRALGAAVDWLLKQDQDEEEAPRLPIAEILSKPDEAAKLIREAVTKLHASRRQDTKGEIATDVVNDLKDLASDDQEGWDSATPQIRKAMSKLPKGMRPEVAGFTEDDDGQKREKASSTHVADIFELEAQIAEILDKSLGPNAENDLPSPQAFSSLFGASPHGLLSCWQHELQPGMVMSSSGRTLHTLMVQETRGPEHERLSRALAGLLPRAIEMKDFESARAIADALIFEIRRVDADEWRQANGRLALQSVEKAVLREPVQVWAESEDPDARRTACCLVECLPELALQMLDLLGRAEIVDFGHALSRGIVGCGSAAVRPLRRVLSEGRDIARDLALDALIQMNTTAALKEACQALLEADDAFAIRALARLSTVNHPDVVDAAVALLDSRSSAVRSAVLAALGELAVPATVPAIIQAASRRGLGESDVAEKVTALETLGRIGSEEARDYLAKVATYRPLLGRRRYEPVRVVAQKLLAKKEPAAVHLKRAA